MEKLTAGRYGKGPPAATGRSGEHRVFDVSPFLGQGLFQQLRDEALFARVRLALGAVEWPNGVDLDPEALFDLSSSGNELPLPQARPPQSPSGTAEEAMPTISMFSGIIIRMFSGDREHDPPQIHALHAGDKGSFRIDDCSVLTGSLPVGKRRLVEAWIELRRDELLADWALVRAGQTLERIEPLR